MDRRFVGVVAAALAIAAVAGALSEPPTEPAPVYALESPLVYRLEVGGVFFIVLYTGIVLPRLAAYGLTPSRVGTAAVHLPQLMNTVGAVNDDLDTTDHDIADMLVRLGEHAARIEAIEESATGEEGRSHERGEVQQPAPAE